MFWVSKSILQLTFAEYHETFQSRMEQSLKSATVNHGMKNFHKTYKKDPRHEHKTATRDQIYHQQIAGRYG